MNADPDRAPLAASLAFAGAAGSWLVGSDTMTGRIFRSCRRRPGSIRWRHLRPPRT
jgi:hypothetical protein